MFSDLFENLRNRWRSTMKPAMQSLISEKRSLFSAFAVLLLLETLLGTIFFSYANNQSVENALQTEIGLRRTEAGSAADAGLKDALETLTERSAKMAEMNRAVFLFVILVWFAVAFFIVLKIISSSVELKKFVYGLYITFGAHTKKIRRLIFWQMMTLGSAALIPAVPLSLLICRMMYGYLPGGAAALRSVLLILAATAVLLFAVIGTVAFRTTAQTCISLLTASDVSSYVISPRRSAKDIAAGGAFRLACISIVRMRKYYVSLVIAAILPASIFFCCMSLASSSSARSAQAIDEYTFTYSDGFSFAQYRSDFQPALEALSGVVSTSITCGDSADALGVHALLSREQIANPAKFVSCYAGSANDSVKLLSADPFSLKEKMLCSESVTSQSGTQYPMPEDYTGCFGIRIPTEGTALMVYPTTVYGNYPEPYVQIFTPTQNTFVAFPDENMFFRSLEDKMRESSHTGISLKVTQLVINDFYKYDIYQGLAIFQYQRLDEELLIVNPVDFKRLTGIDAEANARLGLPTDPVPLSAVGSYLCATSDSGEANTVSSPSLHTVPHSALYAGNEFAITAGDQTALIRFGLPEDTVLPQESGTVTLLLRPDSLIRPDVDMIRLSGRNDLAIDPFSEEGRMLTKAYLIQKAIRENPQYYQGYRVCDVVVTDDIEADTVLMAEEDIAAIYQQSGAYTRLEIAVDGGMDFATFCGLLTSLYQWADQTPANGVNPELSAAGTLWNTLLTKNCRYNEVIRSIALLLLLSVPFIWFCQQFNHYRKRKSDLDILLALGQRKSTVFKIFLFEGMLLAGMSTLAALLICPAFTCITYGFLWFNGFPFAYTSLDFSALLAVLGFSALCAIAITLLNYVLFFSGRSSAGSAKSTLKEEKE